MSNLFKAFAATAFIGLAAPASAFSIGVDFPTLTYPPVSKPDVTQGCNDLTTVTSTVCPSGN